MPEIVKVRESRKEGAKAIDVTYDFGSNLEVMSKKFGPETVYGAALETFKSDLRKMVRTRLNAKETDDQINAAVKAWIPGARSGDPKLARIHKLLDQLPGAEQAAILKRFKMVAS